MFDQELPIPLIIYRINPEEAYQLGILAQTVSDIGQLRNYSEVPELVKTGSSVGSHAGSHVGSMGPAAQTESRKHSRDFLLQGFKPIAALSNAAGIARSRKEGCLWLLHPQLGELQPYRNKPLLLALEQSYGFCEAYLPHNSSAIPYEWYSEAQLRQFHLQDELAESLQQEKMLSEPWLGHEEHQNLLGVLAKHFFFWQSLGRKLFGSRAHAALPQKRKDYQELLQQAYCPSKLESALADLSDHVCTESNSFAFEEYQMSLQPRYSKKQKAKMASQGGAATPPQAWLFEAQASLKQLQNSLENSVGEPAKFSKKEQSQCQIQSLAQCLWALLAFWASLRLRPEAVLRKLTDWLQLEQYHQALETENLQRQLELEAKHQAQAIAQAAIEAAAEAEKQQATEPSYQQLGQAVANHPQFAAWQSQLRQDGWDGDLKGG